MSDADSMSYRYLAWPAYFVALLLIATPALDLLTNVWPVRMGNAEWRYGAVGLMSGFLLTPLLGLVIGLAAATALDHRRVVRVAGVVSLISGVVLVAGTLSFALDVLQIRGTVTAEARSTFDLGAVKAALKNSSGVVAFGWLGAVSVKAGRRSARRRSRVPLMKEPRRTPGDGGKTE
jgi:hypothetical protein